MLTRNRLVARTTPLEDAMYEPRIKEPKKILVRMLTYLASAGRNDGRIYQVLCRQRLALHFGRNLCQVRLREPLHTRGVRQLYFGAITRLAEHD